MFRFLSIAIALVLGGCINLVTHQPPSQPPTFAWRGDVALLNVVALDGSGNCSGWMISERELITAAHCTEQLISMTACFYPDLECVEPIRLKFIGSDMVHDVAVMQLPEGEKRRSFPVRTKPLVVAEVVYAVGYPVGEFSVTQGLFSQRHPAEHLWDSVYTDWLQHNALVAPGSSGGTLLDRDGNIVGMTIGGRTIGPRATFFFMGIANPADIIQAAYEAAMKSPAPPPSVGVVGEPKITRYPQ